MITTSSNFMGSFKLGDNIVYNLSVLRELYALQEAGNANQTELLRKPIILVIASIAEALLFDLYLRIEHYTNEGVPNIPNDVLEEIRTKTIDEFSKYIANAKSKSLLGTDPALYDALDELRKLRNRIHIQNTKNHFEPDDRVAFNSVRQTAAERTLEILMKTMERDYTRVGIAGFVDDFILPWSDHATLA
jgi:hypothetical protein